MSNLPYIQPERELHYNLGIVLLILECLSQTKRNKKVLTVDKLQSFYFLVTRPAFLNKVLHLAGKDGVDISSTDYYTVETLAVNVDELFDRERLLTMLKILSAKECVSSEYSKTEGFVFDLSEIGEAKVKLLKEGYFERIRRFLEPLASLQSQSPSKLNGLINTVLKQGI